MTERRSRAEIVRLGNRYLEMMAGGDSASDVAARYSVPTWRLWADVNVARAQNAADTLRRLQAAQEVRDAHPDPIPLPRLHRVVFREPWTYLTPREVFELHAIRDEIKAADALAIK